MVISSFTGFIIIIIIITHTHWQQYQAHLIVIVWILFRKNIEEKNSNTAMQVFLESISPIYLSYQVRHSIIGPKALNLVGLLLAADTHSKLDVT